MMCPPDSGHSMNIPKVRKYTSWNYDVFFLCEPSKQNLKNQNSNHQV